MTLYLASDFIAEKRFAFFSTYFSETEIQSRLDMVEEVFFPSGTIDLWGNSRVEGLKLKTAELLQIDIMNAAQLASMAANLQAGGMVYNQPSMNANEMYASNPFGQQYEQLRKMVAATGFYF
jgi:hypothetical protein